MTPLWVPAFAGTHASQAKMIAPRTRALLQVHEHPAVDEQRGAGNIGGNVGGEEDDRPDQILGLAAPAAGGARFDGAASWEEPWAGDGWCRKSSYQVAT